MPKTELNSIKYNMSEASWLTLATLYDWCITHSSLTATNSIDPRDQYYMFKNSTLDNLFPSLLSTNTTVHAHSTLPHEYVTTLSNINSLS